LNIAFLYGHPEIARMLLRAKADLDYVNRRMWTSPRYIFDPELSKLDTSHLLEICLTEEFDQWNSPDAAGWTILHRAAAFGQARDVTTLIVMGADTTAKVSVMYWMPIHCAAKFGNLSTFDVLADKFPRHALKNLTDSRGWTFLHLAAASGSLDLLVSLLCRRLSPDLRSNASHLSVPQGLEGVEATPLDIARACGQQDVYLRSLKLARTTA
jgi:ankyrin repeat protein